VIDSTFYGVFLNNHPPDSSTPWFHGQVIDMLFFPLVEFYWPDWVPGVGGDSFLFFSPVFNIADSSIFVGVVMILIFQRKFFKDKFEDHDHDHHHDSGQVQPQVTEPATPETPSGRLMDEPLTESDPEPLTESSPERPKE
jgi:signal peptidase II